MDKITFCIPSKDNLRYLKTCLPSIRKNAYRDDHDIIVFVDRDTDGTIDWLNEVKTQYNIKVLINPNLNKSLYGIGKAYDKCIEEAETEVVMVFHADMMLGKHADKKAFDLLESKVAVCSTRVEPPLHPNGGEKILRDFGVWPEEFNEEAFDDFVQGEIQSDKVTNGIFAPWMIYKKEFLAIGGHDPILKSCREDSDVFNRLMLDGFKFRQPWNSLVYHLTGRGAGSFSGDEERHKQWQQEMENSTKEFIRKWGSLVMHDRHMKPIVTPKYDIGFEITNCSYNFLAMLEPWCTSVIIDNEEKIIEEFISEEQKSTAFNLSKKIGSKTTDKLQNDIIVRIDRNTFTAQDFQYLQQISQIITDSGEVGEFQLGNLFINISSLTDYTHNLVKL